MVAEKKNKSCPDFSWLIGLGAELPHSSPCGHPTSASALFNLFFIVLGVNSWRSGEGEGARSRRALVALTKSPISSLVCSFIHNIFGRKING